MLAQEDGNSAACRIQRQARSCSCSKEGSGRQLQAHPKTNQLECACLLPKLKVGLLKL